MAKKQITKFTVDRARWLTGKILKKAGMQGGLYSKVPGLPLPMQCCLGFLAREAGESCKTIAGEDTINPNWAHVSGRLPEGLLHNQPDIAEVNDAEAMPPRAREKKLKKLFAEYGITVSFKGKAPRIQDVKAAESAESDDGWY